VAGAASSDPGAANQRRKERAMPLINVKLIEDVFDQEQKQDLIERLTDTLVEVEGEYMRPYTWVVIEEVAGGEWGIGGKPLSATDVKAIAAAS
jgi:4-oxalocrotonate tautomerase